MVENNIGLSANSLGINMNSKNIGFNPNKSNIFSVSFALVPVGVLAIDTSGNYAIDTNAEYACEEV